MGDKRSVATDALETLGTIIDDQAKRDAIHLAVEPVVAGERLTPGQHITVRDGTAYRASVGHGLGIVDPFLTETVDKGERFWFVMYPRTITSLRHVWAHPAFPDALPPGPEESIPPAIRTLQAKEASERWLRNFIDTADCPSYEVVIGAIADGNRVTWDQDYLHFKDSNAHGEIPPEFWEHVEIVIGRKLDRHPSHFSCSC